MVGSLYARAILCVLVAFGGGCASAAGIRARIDGIQQKHAVTIRADNPLSRCYLFGNLPGLLDRIDRELERAPPFFKGNLGPIIIEETFIDNPATYPFPCFVRGYVDPGEEKERFPVHIKNRSVLEKVVFFAPRDGAVSYTHLRAHET